MTYIISIFIIGADYYRLVSMWVLVTTILFTSGVEAKHRLPVNHAEAFPTWEKCELNRRAIDRCVESGKEKNPTKIPPKGRI